MKRIYRITLCLLLVAASVISFTACRDPYIESGSGYTSYDGVTLEIKSIDYSGEYIKLNTEWKNTTLHEVIYGAAYTVERYVDGDWISSMRADVSFIEIAYVLSPLGSQDKSYTLQFADISKEGTYRIKTSCHVHDGDEVTYVTLYATFNVDNEYTVASYHKLDYELKGFLYEDLKPYYKAGEKVTVKIGKVYDLGFDLYLDGEELVMESWDGDYWQYSFIMPDHPVKLTCKTYDGFVSKGE